MKQKEEKDTGIDSEILEIMKARQPQKIEISPKTLILSRILFGKFK